MLIGFAKISLFADIVKGQNCSHDPGVLKRFQFLEVIRSKLQNGRVYKADMRKLRIFLFSIRIHF